jgi:hypothetical protein
VIGACHSGVVVPCFHDAGFNAGAAEAESIDLPGFLVTERMAGSPHGEEPEELAIGRVSAAMQAGNRGKNGIENECFAGAIRLRPVNDKQNAERVD